MTDRSTQTTDYDAIKYANAAVNQYEAVALQNCAVGVAQRVALHQFDSLLFRGIDPAKYAELFFKSYYAALPAGLVAPGIVGLIGQNWLSGTQIGEKLAWTIEGKSNYFLSAISTAVVVDLAPVIAKGLRDCSKILLKSCFAYLKERRSAKENPAAYIQQHQLA